MTTEILKLLARVGMHITQRHERVLLLDSI
jgi:hypothetical protein